MFNLSLWHHSEIMFYTLISSFSHISTTAAVWMQISGICASHSKWARRKQVKPSGISSPLLEGIKSLRALLSDEKNLKERGCLHHSNYHYSKASVAVTPHKSREKWAEQRMVTEGTSFLTDPARKQLVQSRIFISSSSPCCTQEGTVL